MKNEPRAFTVEESQRMLLDHFMGLANYWSKLPDKTDKEKLDGLLFSILVTFDGGSGMMPAFDITPCPHESDKQYCIDSGDNYWEPTVINSCQLHELLCQMERERKQPK